MIIFPVFCELLHKIHVWTHWCREKMDAMSLTTILNAFSWMKIFKVRLKFRWSLFPKVQLINFQHWFRQWLGAVQATSHDLNQWWSVYQSFRHVTCWIDSPWSPLCIQLQWEVRFCIRYAQLFVTIHLKSFKKSSSSYKLQTAIVTTNITHELLQKTSKACGKYWSQLEQRMFFLICLCAALLMLVML